MSEEFQRESPRAVAETASEETNLSAGVAEDYRGNFVEVIEVAESAYSSYSNEPTGGVVAAPGRVSSDIRGVTLQQVEKKVDLLLALLVDEQLWANSPGQTDYVLRQLLERVGWGLTVKSDVSSALNLIRRFQEENPIFSRENLLQTIGRLDEKIRRLTEVLESNSANDALQQLKTQIKDELNQLRADLLTELKSLEAKLDDNNKLVQQVNNNFISFSSNISAQVSSLVIGQGQLQASINKLLDEMQTFKTSFDKQSTEIAELSDKINR